MIDPIEQTMSGLEYLRVRLGVIRETAEVADHTGINVSFKLRSIVSECLYLVEQIDRMRKTLDPQIRTNTPQPRNENH